MGNRLKAIPLRPIKEAGLIEVWTISEAIEKALDPS
jgi:hypothetical protein